MVKKRYRDSKGALGRQQHERHKLAYKKRAFRRRQMREKWRSFKSTTESSLKRILGLRPLTPEELKVKRIRRHRKAAKQSEILRKFKVFIQNPFKTVFKSNPLAAERRRIRRFQRIASRNEFKTQLKNTRSIFRELTAPGELRRKYRNAILQSTAWYLISFLVLYVVYQCITILLAGSFNIPVIWNYDKLDWPLYTWSPLYTRTALVFIFGAGPVASLIFAFIFLGMFLFWIKNTTAYHIFFLWCFINGLNLFFGSYLVGVITRTEFIYTSEWLFMSRMLDKEEIIFGLLSLVAMFVAGRVVSPLLLITSSSLTLLNKRYRFFYIFGTAVVPWLSGILVFYLLSFPDHYLPLILKTITPGFIVLPLLFNFNSITNENAQTRGLVRRHAFCWSIIILVAALLFFYRIILNFGWKLG